MIIGDSYMNDFVPWLVNNYKNVVIINPRSYSGKLDVAIDKYNPDEIMIMDYIFTASFEDICKKIENLAK